MASFPVVGTLFNPSSYGPKWSQPGGPGTPVFPAQQTGEIIGLWVGGCGHAFNSWLIEMATVSVIQSAVIMCPLCRYVQRIITPASDLYSQANDIVFA